MKRECLKLIPIETLLLLFFLNCYKKLTIEMVAAYTAILLFVAFYTMLEEVEHLIHYQYR